MDRGPLREVPGGVTIEVSVHPRSHRDEVVGIHADAVKVRLTAPPVDGEANDALVRFVARLLGVPRAGVTILRGQTARRKTVLVRGVSAQEAGKVLLG